MKQVAFIQTGDGNISLVDLDTFKPYSIGTSHPNYLKIIDALKSGNYEGLENMIDIPKAITTGMTAQTNGAVTVRDGQVFYNDLPMHNTVTERIMAFLREGLPIDPLVKFLENLMANPMPMAVAELYDFLDHEGFPITEDGCFVGYKGVNENFTDCHTHTFDNTPNITEPRPGLRMPKLERSEVNPDRRVECGTGLHVGTLEYATNFATNGRVVLVKVNPRDCIAVPKDYDCSKLRVCEYKVIGEAEKLIKTPMHPMPSTPPESYDPYVDDCHNDNDWDNDDDYYDDDKPTVGDVINSLVPLALPKRNDETFSPANVSAALQNPLSVKPYDIGRKVKTPKRKACGHCGAGGGKKHHKKCRRPKK